MAGQRGTERGEQQREMSENGIQETKDRYLRDARHLYQDFTAQQAWKELKKLERRRGIFGWLRRGWDGFWNIVKIAVYSVLLGRQAAERQISLGNREEARKKEKDELEKEAKISVLEEKIQVNEQKEHQEYLQPESVENRGNPVKEQGGNPIDFVDRFKEEPEQGEEPKLLKPGNYTCLGIQCQQVTEMYQSGLSQFLEEQTGLKSGSIHVLNGERDSIQIRISSADEEKPRFYMEIHANGSVHYPGGAIGSDLNSRKFEGDLLKSIMYYTAKVYNPAKDIGLSRYGFPSDKVSIKPGTMPSMEMIEKISDKKAAYLFGHKLEFKSEKDGKSAWIDGRKIPTRTDQTLCEHVTAAMKEKINEDYEKIQSISRSMQRFVRDKNHHLEDLAVSRQYSYGEISDTVHKLIMDRTTDGSPRMTRTDSAFGYPITIYMEPTSDRPDDKKYRRITSVQLNGTEIYQAPAMETKESAREMRGLLKRENEVIAAALQSSFCVLLEAEGKFHISEKAKSIHETLLETDGQITALDIESGRPADPIAARISEGDIETLKELLYLGHEEDIQKSLGSIELEKLTPELACFLELYSMESRDSTVEEGKETGYFDHQEQETIEQGI